jgi:hypothetical protein
VNIPGYNPSRILNPYVFADYGNPPTRLRGQVSPVVMQTNQPTIRDPYLDAIADALEGDGPTGGGAFVGGHLAPGSQMLGNYQDRTRRGGTLARDVPLLVAVSSVGVDDTQASSVLDLLRGRLALSPLFQVDRIEWGTHRFANTLLVRVRVRLDGTDAGAVQRDVSQALLWTNTRIGGAHLRLERIAPAGQTLAGLADDAPPAPDFGEDFATALFSQDPASLVRPPVAPPPTWWERDYLGMPLWALGAVTVIGVGTAAWWMRRRR